MEQTKKHFWKKDFFLPTLAIVILTIIFFVLESPGADLEKQVKKIQETCQGLESREFCYGKTFANLTRETDWRYAFDVLHKLQVVDSQAKGCHFIAHSISIAETEKNPEKWREIMNTAPTECTYGASHGALEVYASTFPEGKVPPSEIPGICSNPDTNNCTHILGHLLLIINENDIDKSLDQCSVLPHNDFGKSQCLGGIFMERITAFNLIEHGLAEEDALNWPARMPELEALCRSQTGKRGVACWREITHAAWVKFKDQPQQFVNFCESANTEAETRECIDHGLGVMASSYNFQLDKIRNICQVEARAPDFKERCYVHIVSAVLASIPTEVPRMVDFCNLAEREYQGPCFSMLGNFMRGQESHAPLLKQSCKMAQNGLAEKCEFGGKIEVPLYSPTTGLD